MIGETVLYSEMKIIMEKSYLPLWLDFSNILLEETDFYDAMSNTLLNLMPDNFIFEISNLNLLNYIKNKKPNYTFESTFCNCKNSIKNKQYISIDEIKNIYIPLGITNFLIDYFPNTENEYGLFLINYFIKPEFKEYAFQELFIRR